MPSLSTKRFLNRANGGRRTRQRTSYSRRMPVANKSELKYYSELTSTATANAIDGFSALRITQGVQRDQRVGNTIRVKRIEVSFPGLEGQQRSKAYLYSRDGAKGRALGIVRDVAEPDNTRYRIWASKNQKHFPQNVNGTITGEVKGPSFVLSKNFSIPMKVTYDEDSDISEMLTNGIYIAWYKSTVSNDNCQPVFQDEAGAMQLRVWYYDA